jgi:peptidoglycan/LPS O-acetylase OafA/YrhL
MRESEPNGIPKEAKMKTVSWIILLVAGALLLLGSFASLNVAYRSNQDRIAGVSLPELAAGKPNVETALKARRGTAASFAAGFAALFLAIVLGPYRKGDRWAWWAVLIGTLVVTLLVLLRMPALGISFGGPGAGTAEEVLIFLGVVGFGLALGAGRLKGGAGS